MRPLLALLGELTTTAASRRAPEDESQLPRDRVRNRKLSAAIAGAWGLFAIGALLQVTLNRDGAQLGSGLCVMWLAVLALMLTTRMRRLLVREGELRRLWSNRLWTIFFAISSFGWVQWYVFVQLQR